MFSCSLDSLGPIQANLMINVTHPQITHSIEHIVRFMLRLPLLPAQLRLDCHILTPGDSYTRLLVIVRIYI